MSSDLMTLLQTAIAVGTGAFVIINLGDKFLKAQVEIAKEKSVGAKAIAELTARLQEMEKTLKHWDETYKDLFTQFLNYLNNKK